MHGNPETAQESPKNISFLGGFWAARKYQKFSNPEREYQIPEDPIPGLFGNTEFSKMFYSWTSGFPKQKNSRMAPP